MNDCIDTNLGHEFRANSIPTKPSPAPDLKFIANCYTMAMDTVVDMRNDRNIMGDLTSMLQTKKEFMSSHEYITDMVDQAAKLGLKTDDLQERLVPKAGIISQQGRAELLLDIIVMNLDDMHQKITDTRKASDIGAGTTKDLIATGAIDTANNLARFVAGLAPSADHGCPAVSTLHSTLINLRDNCRELQAYPPGRPVGQSPEPTSF